MTRQTAAHLAFVTACCIAGFAVGYARRPSSEAPDELAQPQASAVTGSTASLRVPRRVNARGAPLGWRRPDAADKSELQFEPVVVNPDQLPADAWPADTTRDTAWAAPMEAAMSAAVASELAEAFPEVRVAKVTCLSARCDVDLTIPQELSEDINAFIAQTIPLGPRMAPSFDDGAMSFDVDLTELGGADDWKAWHDGVREHRRADIERIVKGAKEGKPWREW
jgi:hypothetical protein